MTSNLGWPESAIYDGKYCRCRLCTDTGYDKYDPQAIINSIKKVIEKINKSRDNGTAHAITPSELSVIAKADYTFI